MIITKMALSRRTLLRGIGVSLALPLLDAMVPALSAVADGREAGAALRVLLHAEWRGDEPYRRELLEAEDGRRRLRVLADPEAARAVPESGDRSSADCTTGRPRASATATATTRAAPARG